MKYLVDPTLLLESDKSKDVTLSMQYSVNPTLVLGGDTSFDHVLSIYSYVPFEQGRIPLSPSTLPPSPRMLSFDLNDLVHTRLPSFAPFKIMGVRRCIIDEGSSTSILSSSTWKYLGSPKILSTTSELWDFERSISWEPWPPP
jgi:hypothetical protein